MLYNKPPGSLGPLGNAPPNYATSAVGRQGISSIGGQPSMTTPIGVPTGSPLLQPGSGYSGIPNVSNTPPAPNPPAMGSGFKPGIGGSLGTNPMSTQGVSPPANMNPWTSSRNRSTLLRALIGNHTTGGMQ